MTATLFFDAARRELLPMPVAMRARTLAEETAAHGVHTTPDELADLIEASFDHLYRLWMAEFAHAGAPDAAVARQVVSRAGGKLLMGQRVGIARTLRQVFVTRGLPTVVEGLAALDFGAPGDAAHPVSQLVAFRNGFAHGSFASTVSSIETHRALLAELLERVPGLVTQPVMAAVSESEVLAFRGQAERVDALTGEAAPRLAPFVLSADGTRRLDLFPLWVAAHDAKEGWALHHPDPQQTEQRIDVFFARESLRQYAQRWEDECAGLFDHREALRARAWRGLDAAESAALRAAVGAAQLVLVEAHPGCGKAASLAALLEGELVEPGRFADVSVAVLERDEPAQSASTFASFVARAAERALGLPPRGLFAADAQPAKKGKTRELGPSALAREAAARLHAGGRRVLVLIEDAHLGTHAAWGQKETVANVVRALAGSPVHVVATTHPGALAQPFAHDRKVVLGTPAAPRVERVAAVLARALPSRPLHARLLETLAAQPEPVELFALCDALDAHAPGEAVFEPAVERALADLRPVLRSVRASTGAERTHQVFHPVVGEALRAWGGAR
jgi:hypothetical protein